MLKSYRWVGGVGGWVVAHKTLLSSPVPIGIGIWAGLGLDNTLSYICDIYFFVVIMNI